jgi:PAS domain S-box-containing protein
MKNNINSKISQTYFTEIILVAIAIAAFFVIFAILELNQASITESLLKKQAGLQLIDNHVIALAISSQLEDVETEIGDSAGYLSNVKNLQSEQTHSILENTFQNVKQNFPDTILYLLDKNDIIIDGINYNNLTFNGKSLAYRDDIKTIHSTLKKDISNGFYGVDGKFRIAVSYPVFDMDKNLIGIIGVSTPSDLYFSKLTNASSTQSQFSNIFDKNQTYLSTPRKFLIGDSYFGDKVQSYFGRNTVQNKQYSTVFSGTPSSAIYNFGGERINTGFPVYINDENQYFVFVITPTDSIYAESNPIYFSQIIELGIVFAITICVILFIIRKSRKSSRIETELGLKYVNLFENSPDLLRTIDLNGIITDCSRSYAESLGYSKEEIIGASILNHTAENSLTEMSSQLKELETNEKITNKEIWLKRKDNTIFPTLLSGINIYDHDDKVIGRTVSLRDMTEIYYVRKTLEENNQRLQEQYKEVLILVQKLEVANKKLLQANKAKDEFAAMLTHELKTPLVPIQAYADILLSGHLGSLTDVQKERLQIILDNARSLLNLISDILDVQKLELGQLKIVKSRNNIKETVTQSVEALKTVASAKTIVLVNHVNSDIFTSYDDERIKQVITNLIKNSLNACSPQTGKVEISANDSPSEIEISVKDNGKGIRDEDKDKIFRKFYQVDTSSIRESGGTGLGLVICKGIVETNGGKIWFESKYGQETKFIFTIPK